MLTLALDKARFPLGRLVATAGVVARIDLMWIGELVAHHLRGDWGEVCEEDWQLNEDALRRGERLLSAYTVGGERVWIITEWDRSVTTVLFAEEY